MKKRVWKRILVVLLVLVLLTVFMLKWFQKVFHQKKLTNISS